LWIRFWLTFAGFDPFTAVIRKPVFTAVAVLHLLKMSGTLSAYSGAFRTVRTTFRINSILFSARAGIPVALALSNF
jgi:hypothetical protein